MASDPNPVETPYTGSGAAAWARDDLGARLESGARLGPDSDRGAVAGDGDHGVAVEARGSEDDRGAHVYSIVKPTISAPLARRGRFDVNRWPFDRTRSSRSRGCHRRSVAELRQIQSGLASNSAAANAPASAQHVALLTVRVRDAAAQDDRARTRPRGARAAPARPADCPSRERSPTPPTPPTPPVDDSGTTTGPALVDVARVDVELEDVAIVVAAVDVVLAEPPPPSRVMATTMATNAASASSPPATTAPGRRHQAADRRPAGSSSAGTGASAGRPPATTGGPAGGAVGGGAPPRRRRTPRRCRRAPRQPPPPTPDGRRDCWRRAG